MRLDRLIRSVLVLLAVLVVLPRSARADLPAALAAAVSLGATDSVLSMGVTEVSGTS